MAKTPLYLLLLLIWLGAGNTRAQNVKTIGRSIVDTLASPRYHGRGYVNNGDKRAAEFIRNKFKEYNLQSPEKLGSDYFQKFNFTVNSFPGAMMLKCGDKLLEPGKDYLVNLFSRSVTGKYGVVVLTRKFILNQHKMAKLQKKDNKTNFFVIDLTELNDKERKKFQQEIFIYKELSSGIILLTDKKLTWGSANYFTTIPIIEVKKDCWDHTAKSVSVDIYSEMQDLHATQNVIGLLKGKQSPDSFIVITAHYDHLGRMGAKTLFPGANDNASGTAMLLSLASTLAKQNNKYSILFIAFAGEEMGLLGSKYYTEYPVLPLEKIKFLINVDLMGTGEDGVTVVNSSANQTEFDRLKSINEVGGYLTQIKPRNNAPNSDHYPFTQKGVKAIFIYAMGGIQAYHDIYDKPETLPLTKFQEMHDLICALIKTF